MEIPSLNSALTYLGLGLAIYTVWAVWRAASEKRENRSPFLQKITRYGIYVSVIVIGLTTATLGGEAVNLEAMLALMLVGALALPLANAYLNRRRGSSVEHTRGATTGTENAIAKQIKKEGKQAYLNLGGVPLPVDSEPRHIMIAGSTGVGKSVALAGIIDSLRARGDTCILVDSGGELVSRYWDSDKGDVLINPFDARCAPWSPTAEILGDWEAESVAMSIIPDASGDSKEWNKYAQTFLTAVLRKLLEEKACTLTNMLYYAQAAPVKELAVFLAGTPAAPQLESEKTFGSIRTITTNYLRPFAYLSESDTPFSVSEFCRKDSGNFLYLTYREDQLTILRTLIATVLDTASRTILSMPPSNSRRIWLIIDEFGSIGSVQSIIPLATKARKAGGCLIIGVQSTSQIYSEYGQLNAQTILSCLSTWLVMRCNDADTAEYMSRYIGDEEILRTAAGSSSTAGSKETQSWNEQAATQRLILPSEIQQFEVGHGALKLAGNYPLCRVVIPFVPAIEPKAPLFVMRDYTAKPMLKLAAAPAALPAVQAEVVQVSKPLEEPAFGAMPKPARAPFAPTPLVGSPTPGGVGSGQARLPEGRVPLTKEALLARLAQRGEQNHTR